MSAAELPARYTIGRTGEANMPARNLGLNDKGRLVWTKSFVDANTFETEEDADTFRRNRLAQPDTAEVVRHTIH